MQSLSVAEVIPQLYISITTLAFNLLLWLMAEQKGMRHFPSGRPFYFLVVSVFVANVLSGAATLFQFADTGAPGILVSALQALVYLSNALVTYFFSVYFIGFISEKKGKKGTVPPVNSLLLVLLFILVAGWFAWSAPQMIRTGEARFMEGILLVIAAWVFVVYYMLYCVAYLVINRRLLMRRERRVIALGLILTVVFTIAQGFVGPVLQVNFLGGTLGLMILYFSFYADAGPVWQGERDDRHTDTAASLQRAALSGQYGERKHADAAAKERVRRRSSIRLVFVVISAIMLISYLVLGAFLYGRAQELFLNEVQGNALGNAKTIAEFIDGEAHSSLRPGAEGTAAYTTVQEVLSVFRTELGLEYVYTIILDGEGVPAICVDSDSLDAETFAPIGSGFVYSDATFSALAGKGAADETPVTDEWGIHLSAYAPIMLNGEVIGAVGVDVDYTWVEQELRRIVFLTVAVCLLCFAVSMLLLLFLARNLSYKFNLLYTKINDLSYDAQGTQRIEGLRSGDEFELIADHINEVFEKNMETQHAEAEKLRSAMSEVERRAEEKVAGYAAQMAAMSVQAEEMTEPQTENDAFPRTERARDVREASGHEQGRGDILPEIEDGLTKEEAIRRVRAATPAIMASYRGLIEALQPYFGEPEQESDAEADTDLPEMEAEELQELYEAIAEFAEIYDADGIEKILQQTAGFRVPEAEREKIARIRECVKNSDWNELKKSL